MSNTIYLMVGIQGSGKSTWANNFMEKHNNTLLISRDLIRKNLIGDEEYFSKEDEVWDTFVKSISAGVKQRFENIIIDATHISIASRRKILNALVQNAGNVNEYNLKIVVMDTPLMICLHRNDEREGFELVPKNVIKKFSEQFEMPTNEELVMFENKFKDIDIMIVKG